MVLTSGRRSIRCRAAAARASRSFSCCNSAADNALSSSFPDFGAFFGTGVSMVDVGFSSFASAIASKKFCGRDRSTFFVFCAFRDFAKYSGEIPLLTDFMLIDD